MTSCLCLGPKRAGKSHLLKALQNPNAIDETSYSVPTIGTSIFNIRFPTKYTTAMLSTADPAKATATAQDPLAKAKSQQSKTLSKSIQVLEIGGTMAPMWRQYFNDVTKIIYVVDTSNLCQISAAGKYVIRA